MPIEHSDIGLAEIHLVHNWEYADAAARTGASGFIASDVGKWAKQLDDGTFWELTATTPTWVQVAGPTLPPAAHAAEHENGGSDEIDVTGLSGLLADPQTPLPPEIIDETGAPVTLDGSHNGNVVLVDNDVTVPSGLGSGFSVMLIQTGASSVEILESGTTVNNRQGHTHIADQFGVVTLFAYAANTFVLGGDTAT